MCTTRTTYPTHPHDAQLFPLKVEVGGKARWHGGRVVFVGQRLLRVDVSEVPAERPTVELATQRDTVGDVAVRQITCGRMYSEKILLQGTLQSTVTDVCVSICRTQP